MRTPTLALLCLWSLAALAKPPGPATFCAQYPTAPACSGGQPACTYCHTSPPTAKRLRRERRVASAAGRAAPALRRRLRDGAAGGARRRRGGGHRRRRRVATWWRFSRARCPADAHSFPHDIACAGDANPAFKVCQYDAHYAYRKVALDFCGFSPTYAQLVAFDALSDADEGADASTTS